MNLLSNLIGEYKAREARKTLDAMAKKADEDNMREYVKREALHQLAIQGPLTAYELAEMLSGAEAYVSHEGWEYTVMVVCANGFELRIIYNENPQRPGEATWGHPRIYTGEPDDRNRPWEFFIHRATVSDFIGRYLAQGGA